MKKIPCSRTASKLLASGLAAVFAAGAVGAPVDATPAAAAPAKPQPVQPAARPAAPPRDPLRIIPASMAAVRAALVEAEALTAAGRHAEAAVALERAMAAFQPSEGNLLGSHLTNDLLLERLRKNALARFDGAAELRWWQAQVDLRTAFWGPEAPATQVTRNDYAARACELGECRKALAMQEDVYQKTLALRGPKAANTLTARHNYAVSLARIGRHEEALKIDGELADEARAQWGENDARTLRYLNGMATNLTDLGRYAEALALHERIYAARKALLGADAPDTLSSLGSLAATYSLLERRKEAMDLSRRVYEQTRQAAGENHPRTLAAASELALELRRVGQLNEALALAQRTLEGLSATVGERHPATLTAMNVTASILKQMERVDEALELAHKAYGLRVDLMGENDPLTLQARQSLGAMQMKRGDAAGALQTLTEVQRQTAALYGERHPYTLMAAIELVDAALAADRIDSVRPLLPGLQAGVEALRAQHGLSSKSRRTLFERYVQGYRAYALISLRGQDAPKAFELAELSKARTLLESTALQRANRAGILPREAQAEVDRHEQHLARLDQALDAAGAGDKRQLLEAERNRVVQAYADLQRALRARHPKYRRLSEAPLARLEDAAHLLPADGLFVSYLLSRDTPMLFAVDRRGLALARELPALPGLAQTLEAYRKLTGDALEENEAVWQVGAGAWRIGPKSEPPAPGAQPVADAAPIAAWLGERLVAPLRELLAGKRRLIVSPDAGLALLPFETLTLDGTPLVERHSVSYVQSLSMLALLQARVQEYRALGSRKALLAVGNPVYRQAGSAAAGIAKRAPTPPGDDAAAAARSVMEDSGDVSEALQLLRETEWDALPGTEKEIAAVRRTFARARTDTLTGRAAAEGRLLELDRRGALAQYRTLLFSVHGYLSTDVPALSALVLSQVDNPAGVDGYVTAAEWAGYTLRSDLMVMSACDTGVGKVVQGEGVMGLPYSLYVAGNANTVMTLWPVSDAATARFMQAFFQRINAGQPSERALSDTKKDFAAGRHGEPLRKAAYWAPFVLYGD